MRFFLLILLALFGCDTPDPSGPDVQGTAWTQPWVASELSFGANDNPEVVALVPSSNRAIVVSSKARKLSLVSAESEELIELRSRALFSDDASESELTYAVVAGSGEWAAITRTVVTTGAEGEVTGCEGELVLVSIVDGEGFGEVLSQVPVGPMPDSVAISPSGDLLAVGNERDVVWGKCEGVEVESPSISFLSVESGTDGRLSVRELTRISMTTNLDREPEQLVFSADGTRLFVTLQDSHELTVVTVADALESEALTDEDLAIARLLPNDLGQDPWPDGIAMFSDGEGAEHVAVAGEANDTLMIFDAGFAGNDASPIATLVIAPRDIPASFPRDGSWGPLFQPDSIASFRAHDLSVLAVTLKSSGAVLFVDVTDASDPRVLSLVKVGRHEEGTPDSVSTVLSEGIAASDGFAIVANEGDGSVTMLRW